MAGAHFDIHSGLRGPVGLGRAASSSRLWRSPGLPASDAFTISRQYQRQRPRSRRTRRLRLMRAADNPHIAGPVPFAHAAAESSHVRWTRTPHAEGMPSARQVLSAPSAHAGRVASFRGCRLPESSRFDVLRPGRFLMRWLGRDSSLRSFAWRCATRSVRSWRPRADRSSPLASSFLTRRKMRRLKRARTSSVWVNDPLWLRKVHAPAQAEQVRAGRLRLH